MPTDTLKVSENQRDIIRRGAAHEAHGTARALASWFESIEDGYPDRNRADHARESVEGLMDSMRDEVAVLMQVPWSDEEEREAKGEAGQ